MKFGPVKDIALGASINAGTDVASVLVGPRISLDVPWFKVLTVGAYYYDNFVDPFDRDLDSTYQLTAVWDAPIDLGPKLKFRTKGFIDYIGEQGSIGGGRNYEAQIVASPQLRFDVGNLWGDPGRVEAGIEYYFFDNKFGNKGVTDHAVQGSLAVKLH